MRKIQTSRAPSKREFCGKSQMADFSIKRVRGPKIEHKQDKISYL